LSALFVKVVKSSGVIGERRDFLSAPVGFDGASEIASFNQHLADTGIGRVVISKGPQRVRKGLFGQRELPGLKVDAAEVDHAPGYILRRGTTRFDGAPHDLNRARDIAGQKAIVGRS